MKLLSTPEVIEVADIPQRTLAEWGFKGLVTPAVKGKQGRGHSDQFTLMQVVGIAVAVELRSTDRGCVLSYVEKVVTAFGNMTEKKLEKEFNTGGTCFCSEHMGSVIFWGKDYPDRLDVQEIYNAVKKVAGRKEKE